MLRFLVARGSADPAVWLTRAFRAALPPLLPCALARAFFLGPQRMYVLYPPEGERPPTTLDDIKVRAEKIRAARAADAAQR